MEKLLTMWWWMTALTEICWLVIIVFIMSWLIVLLQPNVQSLLTIHRAIVFSCMPILWWWLHLIWTLILCFVRCGLIIKYAYTGLMFRAFVIHWFIIQKTLVWQCIVIPFFGMKDSSCWEKKLRSIWMTVRLTGPILSIRHWR